MPLDAPVDKPVRLELDPEATSDAAIAGALGAGVAELAVDMPIDAPDDVQMTLEPDSSPDDSEDSEDWGTTPAKLRAQRDAETYYDAGEYREAIRCLKEALVSSPGDSELEDQIRFVKERQAGEAERLCQAADGLSLERRYAEARKVYDEALAVDPDHAASAHGLARVESLATPPAGQTPGFGEDGRKRKSLFGGRRTGSSPNLKPQLAPDEDAWKSQSSPADLGAMLAPFSLSESAIQGDPDADQSVGPPTAAPDGTGQKSQEELEQLLAAFTAGGAKIGLIADARDRLSPDRARPGASSDDATDMTTAMEADLLTAEIMAAGLAAGFTPPDLRGGSGNTGAALEYQVEDPHEERFPVTGWGSDDDEEAKIAEGVPPASPVAAARRRQSPKSPKRPRPQKSPALQRPPVVPVGVSPFKAKRWADAHAQKDQELTLQPKINKKSAKMAQKMKLAPLGSPERTRQGPAGSSNGSGQASKKPPTRLKTAASAVIAASKLSASERSLNASELHAERARKARQTAAAAPPAIGRKIGPAVAAGGSGSAAKDGTSEFRPVINKRSKELVGKRPMPPRSMGKEQELAVVQCARWVVQYGDAFESVVAEKNAGNPLFDFLTEAKQAAGAGGTAARPSPVVRFFNQRKAYERLLATKPAAAASASSSAATSTPPRSAKKKPGATPSSLKKGSGTGGGRVDAAETIDAVDFLLARKNSPAAAAAAGPAAARKQKQAAVERGRGSGGATKPKPPRASTGRDTHSLPPRTPTGPKRSVGAASSSRKSAAVAESSSGATGSAAKSRSSTVKASASKPLPKTKIFRDPVSLCKHQFPFPTHNKNNAHVVASGVKY
jgi:tetratricopeptide (TPR) repeat protein